MLVMARALALTGRLKDARALALPLSAPRRPTQIMMTTTIILKLNFQVLMPDMKMTNTSRHTRKTLRHDDGCGGDDEVGDAWPVQTTSASWLFSLAMRCTCKACVVSIVLAVVVCVVHEL